MEQSNEQKPWDLNWQSLTGCRWHRLWLWATLLIPAYFANLSNNRVGPLIIRILLHACLPSSVTMEMIWLLGSDKLTVFKTMVLCRPYSFSKTESSWRCVSKMHSARHKFYFNSPWPFAQLFSECMKNFLWLCRSLFLELHVLHDAVYYCIWPGIGVSRQLFFFQQMGTAKK